MHHLGSRSRLLRSFVLAAAAAAVAGGTVAIGVSAQSAPTTAALRLDRADVQPGGTLVLHGSGFPRSAHVTLRAGRLHRSTDRVGGADTGRRGGFVARVRIASDVKPGRYVAIACHARCQVKATVHFRVLRP